MFLLLIAHILRFSFAIIDSRRLLRSDLHITSLLRYMTTSRRLTDRKIQKFEENIKKRGFVPETSVKKNNDYPVGPIVLGFFVFVVIGSSIVQIIRTATSGAVEGWLKNG